MAFSILRRRTLQNTLDGTHRKCNATPVVTYLEVAFLGKFDNKTFAPIFWDALIFPNVMKEASQDFR